MKPSLRNQEVVQVVISTAALMAVAEVVSAVAPAPQVAAEGLVIVSTNIKYKTRLSQKDSLVLFFIGKGAEFIVPFSVVDPGR